MKKATVYLMTLLLVLGMGMGSSGKSKASSLSFGVSFQVFYNELSPFGDWVIDPSYGYVWIPYVDRGFQPYVSNGYWAMTNFGNTWVSQYDWGWAPFHYGRWFWSNFYGWAWIPGYEWGPAWVSWRTGGGFYGWAPLGPGMHVGVNFMIPARHWVFVPQRRFRGRQFQRYFVPQHQVVNIYNSTTIINNTNVVNNTTYYTGPSRREIQKVTGSNIPVYQVNGTSRPGRTIVQNNNVNIFRPEVSKPRGSNEETRPSRVFTAEEYRQRSAVQQRNGEHVRINSLESSRKSQALPSRNVQQLSQNQAVRGTNNLGSNGSATRSTQTRQSTNRQAESPAVRGNNQNSQKNPAVRSSSTTRQSSPTISSPSSGSNTKSNSDAVNKSRVNNNNRTASSTRGGRGNE